MKIMLNDIQQLTENTYRKAGYPEEQLPVIVDVLKYAQLRGNLQSLIQIANGVPTYHAQGPVRIRKETSLSIVLNGNDNIGIWVMYKSMQQVMRKAGLHGFAIAGSYKSAPPGTAAIGYYVRKLAEKGLIAFAFSGSGKIVAPHGGMQRLFGTNPIAVGLPVKDSPIVIDMATSSLPLFQVMATKIQHQLLPQGAAFDHLGQPTQDPEMVLQNGTLTTFAAHPKSSALSFLVEVLTGPLVGAAFATSNNAQTNWGNLIYAYDPELLSTRKFFMKQMEQLQHMIKSSEPLPGFDEIFLPGEQAEKQASETLARGWLEVPDWLGAILNFNESI
ncbi:Ldh family oxidoreductase [Legionella nagasakiensis]|uniref:Ldh family oxidoreductase n=1 Tax=Legionella nagasakiensis TaxID=535290 RepID=UPI001054BC1C|nr:Ldh family oxidoreductase [Legionella nagasakiensis]